MREADDSGPGVLTVSCGFAPFVIGRAGPHQPSHARRTHRHDNNCILVETKWEDNVLCGRRARLARWDAAHHTPSPHLRLAISARAARRALSGDRLATPHTAGPPGTSPRTSNFENCKLEMCVPSSPDPITGRISIFIDLRCHIQTVSAHRSSPWAGLTACSILRESIIGEIWGRYRRDIGEICASCASRR